MKPKNFLFVHGAWHAAAHWNGVVERLIRLDHRAFAIDLPGSGLNATYPPSYLRNDFAAFASEPSPAAAIHLADYADAIIAQLTAMASYGKVTLVGHSFGGLAITMMPRRRRISSIAWFTSPRTFPCPTSPTELPWRRCPRASPQSRARS